MVEGLLGTVGIDEVVVVSVMGCVTDWDTTGVDTAAPLFTSQGFGGEGIFINRKKETNKGKEKLNLVFILIKRVKFNFSGEPKIMVV